VIIVVVLSIVLRIKRSSTVLRSTRSSGALLPHCNDGERLFNKVSRLFPERRHSPLVGNRNQQGRCTMRKLCYVLAAVTALSVAAPTLAGAQEFGFRIGGDHGYYRDRDYGYDRGFDRGWHHGWYNHNRDRTVVIRRQHHWDYDD
jgi:hypothetical protein